MNSDWSIRKVLMTADSIGGVWTYALELIRALRPHGIQALLATMGRRLSKSQWKEVCGLSNVDVAESSYRLEWMDDPWNDVADAGAWLRNLEERFQPDVVHLNGYAHAALPWSAPTLVVAHSCVLSWWQGVKGEDAPSAWAQYRRAVQEGLRAADLVVAPTGAMLNCIVENYGELPFVRVIPNGRALDLFKPLPKENLILGAGRLWDEAKNIKAVCDSSPRLPWPVLVAGEAACPDGRKVDLGAARPLGELCGEELLKLMARAAIFAHPAKYEPFGLSVLEAALSGCALVLGDLPALRENWNDAAIFVDPNSSSSLRAALLRLIEDAPMRERLARAAAERGRQFDIRFTALRYLDAYQSLHHRRALVREEVCA